MRNFYLRLMLVLALISGVAGGILSLVNSYTEPMIAKYKVQAETKAYQRVLPEAELFIDDSDLLTIIKSNPNFAAIQSLKVALKNDQRIGVVFKVASPGYSSNIEMLIGVNNDGKLGQVLILEQKETPGLGSKITDSDFIGQRAIYSSQAGELAVNKDGGTVQAVAGATISSRAVVKGINQALAVYQTLSNVTNNKDDGSDKDEAIENDIDATAGATTKN